MKKIYKIGFTRPALLRESVLVAQIYRESIDWKETKQKISEMHLLQTRTDRSEKILFDEITSLEGLFSAWDGFKCGKEGRLDVQKFFLYFDLALPYYLQHLQKSKI